MAIAQAKKRVNPKAGDEEDQRDYGEDGHEDGLQFRGHPR
jgi:hypothetical protein